MPNPSPDSPSQDLSWPLLLAKWTEYAKAAVALPSTDEGNRDRDSVPAVIALQAICFALSEIHRLPTDERLLGIERAEYIVRERSTELDKLWRGHPMPEAMLDLLTDARQAIQHASTLGTGYRAAANATSPDLAALRALQTTLGAASTTAHPLTAYALHPGTRISAGTPVLFCNPDCPIALTPAALSPDCPLSEPAVTPPIQVYRNAEGDITTDLAAPMNTTMPPGRPLLIPLLIDGDARPLPTEPEIARWVEVQSRMLGDGYPEFREADHAAGVEFPS
jgi:hypothetical protein